MIKAAESQRNVIITLQLVADQKNQAVVKKMVKGFQKIEKAAIKAAKAASKVRLDIYQEEMKKRDQALKKLLKSFKSDTNRHLKDLIKINQDVASTLRVINDRMEKSWKKAEEQKTKISETESKKRESCVEKEADASKKLEEANKKQMDSLQKASEAGISALQGTLDLVEGMSELGLVSEKNFKSLESGFKVLKGFTDLVWKSREALIAMQEAQQAVATTNAIIAAGGPSVSGGTGAAATNFGSEVAESAIANRMTQRKVAKEAAERAAKRTGGGFLRDLTGSLLGTLLMGRGAGAAGGGVRAGAKADGGLLSRIGGATVGGMMRGAGGGVVGLGKGMFQGGIGLGSRIGGMTLGRSGVIGLGALGGYGVSEGFSWLNSKATGREHGSEPPGPKKSLGVGNYFSDLFGNPLYNESPTGAATSTYRAIANMFSSGSRTEEMQEKLEKDKERNIEIRERQQNQLSFQMSQHQVFANMRRQLIAVGEGTDLDKSKRLELQAIQDVRRARSDANKEQQDRMDAMYRGEIHSNELQLMHLERVRDTQAGLVDATRNRLNLLKSQNEEHKRSVESAQKELQLVRDRVKSAEQASKSDREGKLAKFSKLTTGERNQIDRISLKHEAGGTLSKSDVRLLERAGVGGGITQRYRANSVRGYESTLERLGEFDDTDKSLKKVQDEEIRVRQELQSVVKKERESRERVAEQTRVLSRRFEELAKWVQRVTGAQSELSGVSFSDTTDVAAAINNATDSGTRNNMHLLQAVRNMQDQTQQDAEELARQMQENRNRQRIHQGVSN